MIYNAPERLRWSRVMQWPYPNCELKRSLLNSTEYNVRGKYFHNWKFSRGQMAVNVLHSERISRYLFPSAGHVVVFGGSSEIRRNRERKKKENIKKEAALLGKEVCRTTMFKKLRNGSPCSPGVGGKAAVKKFKYSPRATSKIRSYCSAFFRAGATSFITLTFMSQVEDKKAMDCLKAFWQNWRITGKKDDYIYVTERQQNGNVHFHCLVSAFVDINEENARWARIQYNNGIYKYDKDGVPYSREDLEYHIKAGEISKFQNSFDIKWVNDQSGVSYYVTKYISKGVKQGIEYGFRPWSCSRSISKLYKTAVVIPEAFELAKTAVNSYVRKNDCVDSETGEVVHDAGSVAYPTIIKNEYAVTVGILNKKPFVELFSEMDGINRRFLATGILEPERLLTWDEYYTQYCWNYSGEEVTMQMEGYENKFKNDIWRRDFDRTLYSARRLKYNTTSEYYKGKYQLRYTVTET